ncbi:MAG: NAD(P)H-binding protein, partial [Cyanobacteriota bacterium]
ISAARAVGLRRVVLVSSLCAGRWLHPLNLFGLILLWKRVGERALEQSGLDWTVVRPGGLSEREEGLERQGIRFSGPDQQESDSIPRRLVARLCLDALDNPASVGRIIEVTSGEAVPAQDLAAWLATS